MCGSKINIYGKLKDEDVQNTKQTIFHLDTCFGHYVVTIFAKIAFSFQIIANGIWNRNKLSTLTVDHFLLKNMQQIALIRNELFTVTELG